MNSGGVKPPGITSSGHSSQSEDEVTPAGKGAVPKLPRGSSKAPDKELKQREVGLCNVQPRVNQKARLRANYLSQHTVVQNLQTQKDLLTQLEPVRRFMDSPDSDYDSDYIVVYVEEGRTTTVIPPETSLKNDPARDRELQQALKEQIKTIDAHFTPDGRSRLDSDLLQARVELREMGVKIIQLREELPEIEHKVKPIPLNLQKLIQRPDTLVTTTSVRSENTSTPDEMSHYQLEPRRINRQSPEKAKLRQQEVSTKKKTVSKGEGPQAKTASAKTPQQQWLRFYSSGNTHIDGQRWTLSQIRQLDTHQMEAEHDYIQLLFPNREVSGANPDSPRLTNPMIQQVRNTPALQKEVVASLDQMLDFWGLERRGDAVMVKLGRKAKHQKWCLNDRNHNQLRITRVLNFLMACGFENCAMNLEQALNAHRASLNVPANTIWSTAVGKDGSQRPPDISSKGKSTPVRRPETAIPVMRPNLQMQVRSYKYYMANFPYQNSQDGNRICFYNRGEPHFEFTNFYEPPKGLMIDGHLWRTTEHYFQACKFPEGSPNWHHVQNIRSPGEVFRFVNPRDPSVEKPRIPENWHQIKDGIMMKALRAKAQQDERFKMLLLATGDQPIYEDSPKDYTWGIGENGTGQNCLGALLMQLRDELRAGRKLPVE